MDLLKSREPDGEDESEGKSPDAANAPDAAAERTLRCAACGHPVATDAERIEVDGAHESVRVNLAGMLFRVGCFARARGCRGVGESSTHWTWFPGYAWQVGVCAGCGTHLGWIFRGDQDRFYGLLLDELREG